MIAIDITGEPWFDPDARFPEPREILKVCSSLVTLEEVANNSHTSSEILYDKVAQSVRLAHYSVKEYLTSERIRDQPAARYTIQEIPANCFISASCLAYLLQFDQKDSLTSEHDKEFPLARYAAKY